MHLVIFQLDPAAPWIAENRAVTPEKLEQLRADPDQMDLRRRWTMFTELVAAAFRAAGWRVDLAPTDRWAITAEAADGTGADLVFAPHTTRMQFGPTRTPMLFYMQMMQRWLFTVDPLGWGAGAASYPCSAYAQGDADAPTFALYRERIVNRNTSKFAQAPKRSRIDLVRNSAIPDAPYIFFPCQVPHDESLKLFSPYAEEALVGALAEWCAARGVWLVLKEHPANRPSMRALHAAADRHARTLWSEASIHDLIEHAAAVYTLNSGVGFEALLHLKPVATFARAEYDVVAVRGEIDILDTVWQAVSSWDRTEWSHRYSQFIDWYCRMHAVDLSAGPTERANRLERLVAQATEIASGPSEERTT